MSARTPPEIAEAPLKAIPSLSLSITPVFRFLTL
jgi:hypothetical protein